MNPIPERSSSRYAGQYADAMHADRIVEIFNDSVKLAVESKNRETACSRFELAVEVYHELMTRSLPTEIRTSLQHAMAVTADRFPSQVCINEALGYCDRAAKLKTPRKQLENLYRARDVLRARLDVVDVGQQGVREIHEQVLATIAKGEAGA